MPVPAATVTPTAVVATIDSVYTSEKYWYSIDMPQGWRINSADPNAVAIWEPGTGNTIWVTAREIDTFKYPSVGSYADSWQPSPGEGWTGYQILSSKPIRSGAPVEAHEYTYAFTFKEEAKMGRSLWYVLGTYRISLHMTADRSIWGSDSEVYNSLIRVQDSFDPASYTSEEYGYSLAYPSDWVQRSSESANLWAHDPSGGLQVVVRVFPDQGYTQVFDYGTAVGFQETDVISRDPAFPRRSNPSYRIDYRADSEGTKKRWALIITLGGRNAIWVYVGASEDEWPELESVINDILGRVAVRR